MTMMMMKMTMTIVALAALATTYLPQLVMAKSASIHRQLNQLTCPHHWKLVSASSPAKSSNPRGHDANSHASVQVATRLHTLLDGGANDAATFSALWKHKQEQDVGRE